jgi:putative inorganic carbon (hco3(-)) transporter
MSLTTALYFALLIIAIAGSILYHPMVGILTYIVAYHIDPHAQWWGWGVPYWAWRYALIFGLVTLLGMLFRPDTLKFKKQLDAQEILLWVYVALIGLSLLIGLPNPDPENNFIKLAKVAFLLFLASHVITTLKRYELLLCILILTSLYLGISVYQAPGSFFNQGRFQSGVGGSDFSDGNILSGHFVMMLPLIGVMFIKGKWWIKGLCAISGAFTVNSIVLIKSRGSFLAVGVCALFAFFIANKIGRKKVLPFLVIALAAGVYLMDPGYITRMRTLEKTDTQEMDGASLGRLHYWGIALKMAADHPLGIGEGNYIHYVGQYDPSMTQGRDTHNTYLRCLAELGFQGLLILLLLAANAFRILSQLSKKAELLKNAQVYLWHIYALRLALMGFLVVAFFVSATYVEDMFWLLTYPLFLKRCLENEELEVQTHQQEDAAVQVALPS